MKARVYKRWSNILVIVLINLLSVNAAAVAASVEPKNAWQTEGRILRGTQMGHMGMDGPVVDESTFGPPVTWASASEGYCILLIQVAVNAKTDGAWVKAIQSLSLQDENGESYNSVLWFVNGAYRPNLFLSMAEGQGVSSFPSTTIAFHLPTPIPKKLQLVSDGKIVACISALLSKTSRSGIPIPGISLEQEGITAYCLANGVPLKAKPAFGESTPNITELAFGDIVETKGKVKSDWVNVYCPSRKAEGWVHRAAITLDKGLYNGAKKIDAVPEALVYISNIKSSGAFEFAVVSGGVRVGTKRLLADHGMCVVIGNRRLSEVKRGISMKGFGVDQVLSYPPPWSPYFYASAKRAFVPLEELVRTGKVVMKGECLPSEAPVVVARSKAATRWPFLETTVTGRNPVRVVNPNPVNVKVAIRLGTKGTDFDVKANGRHTAYLPDGRYDIYFKYGTDPENLYQGDSITLASQGVEIQLIEVRHGNYSIRKLQ